MKNTLTIPLIILALICGVGVIFAFVFGYRSLEATPVSSVNDALLYFGIYLFNFTIIYLFIGICIIYLQHKARLQQAIAKESMKYSSRSPIPCIWRLYITKSTQQIEGNVNQSLTYYVSSIVL